MMAPAEIAVTVVVLAIILGVPLSLLLSAVNWARSHAKH
jgi:hypothetical protein